MVTLGFVVLMLLGTSTNTFKINKVVASFVLQLWCNFPQNFSTATSTSFGSYTFLKLLERCILLAIALGFNGHMPIFSKPLQMLWGVKPS
jgi:hypothetical protein